MDRSHPENTPAAADLKIDHLYHHGEDLRQVDETHHRQKQRHLQKISACCHEPTQGKGTRISHKYAGGMYIKEQKSQKRPCHRTGNRRNLCLQPHCRHRKKGCHHNGDTARKAVQAGSDIAILYPGEGTSALPDGMAVVAGCAHRENARRFIDFALGEDVQRFLARVCQRRPVLGDAQEELRLIDYDLDWAARAREDVLAWWREMEAAQ